VPNPPDRIFTVEITSYLRRDPAQGYVFATFDIHCVLPGIPRWEKAYVPRIGRWTDISGEVVGYYTAGGRRSLCVIVKQSAVAPTFGGVNPDSARPTNASVSTPR
jgi:hypothetical protein